MRRHLGRDTELQLDGVPLGNITLLTTGTRGDIQPYVALGVALKRAGHAVTVAAPSNLEALVHAHGLGIGKTDALTAEIMNSPAVQDALTADSPLKVLMSFRKLRKQFIGVQGQLYDACAGADLIVFHPGAAIGAHAARQMGIPAVLATPFPMSSTGDYPALVFYNWPRWGRAWNRFSHYLFQFIVEVVSGSPIKQFWKARFQEAPPLRGNPFRSQNSARFPTLVGVSPQVFATPRDWPAHSHATGYWFLDAEDDFEPSAELSAFLGHGAPPVYVGFGRRCPLHA